MFHVGQKVVCVNDQNWRIPGTGRHPIKGSIYTIAAVDKDGVALEEIGPRGCWAVPCPYLASRFRPVVEKSTDTGMAVLKEILERETVKDPAPVNLLEDYRRLAEAMKAEAEWRNSVNR